MAKTLKQYKITFHGEGGDVVVGHNFVVNVYKRNVETTIDEDFLGVVRDAVVHTTSGGEAITIPQYSYTAESI